MIYAVAAGYIISLFIPLLIKLPKKIFGWIIASVPLFIFVYFSTFYNVIVNGKTVSAVYKWIPSMGVNFSFYLDGLGLTFALIISFVGFVVFLYASGYLDGHKYTGRFYIYISIFMASMLGVVTSDNLITLFVFWELTSISSYLLIGFNHHNESSRYGALQALLVTGGGGLALLTGIIILSGITGTTEISSLASMNNLITGHSLYPAAVVLILLGAFTKSAQFPFHFWLPNAMTAPAPVSAYLHSATMVKAGIYLMARLNPSLGGTAIWQDSLLFAGAITMVFTAALAFKQTDLKKLLAYSTLSVLGTLTMLLGIGSDLAIKAFMIYLIAHSLYKGTLFLVAGSIDHETGTRDITKLGGLKTLMPVTAVTAVLASLSKMGIIPLIGFIGKETVYASALEFTDFGFLFITLAVAANIFIVYITLTAGFFPFFGKKTKQIENTHEVPFIMWFGPSLLALSGLILGLLPQKVINSLINFSELGIITEKLNIPVKLWHGFTLELLLSVITVLLGIFVFSFKNRILSITSNVSLSKFIKPSAYYDFALNGMMKTAKRQSKFLQNGYLRYYVMTIIITTVLLAGYNLFSINDFSAAAELSLPAFHEVIIGLVIIAAAYTTVRAKSRLTAVVGLGIVGYSVALIFIMYGAPDLAMTQFAIETLTVILFVLVMYRLPKYLQFSSTTRRVRDFIIAGTGGALMSLIVLFVISFPLNSELKKFFAEKSLAEANGKNIVNVILVDFRAVDTLGEITVLAIAAAGVFALLKLRMNKEEK